MEEDRVKSARENIKIGTRVRLAYNNNRRLILNESSGLQITEDFVSILILIQSYFNDFFFHLLSTELKA